MACRAVAGAFDRPAPIGPPALKLGRGSLRQRSAPAEAGGAEGIRTPDPHNAIVVLYQLSYDPIKVAAE